MKQPLSIDDDKRIHPRFKSRFRQNYRIDLGDMQDIGWLVDFSRGGMSFITNQEIKQGQPYHLRIRNIDQDSVIPCEIFVLWVRPNVLEKNCICGASIITIDSEQKTDILDNLYQSWKQESLSRIS